MATRCKFAFNTLTRIYLCYATSCGTTSRT
nr:MAG TPA: hypothetical protein [Caudoviricetes sp.]